MDTNLNIEQKINKKSETWTDKFDIFFSNIKFIKLSPETKQSVAIKVKNDIITGKLYWIEIFLSSIIAALGLLQNSVAVVIGAMLIAPLLRPINGISYSVSKGEKTLFWLSIKILLLSIFVSILMGFFSAKIIGFSYETNEIIARTSPNILDLFIAIFSAMIAVLSLGFNKLSESVAGVAMAASLMPPLAVVGIELSFGNYIQAYGSMMLFLANLVAILLVGIVIFWLYGFKPHIGDDQKKSVKTFTFIVISMFIISIPLLQSLLSIKEKVEIKKESKIYLENILKNENQNISISNLEVESIDKSRIKIYSIVKVPEGINFYDTFKKQLDFELSKKLGKNVELNIDLIRTANIVSSNKEISLENTLYDYIYEKITKNYSNFDIISLQIEKNNSIYNVKAILGIQDSINFNSNIFLALETKVKEKYGENINFSFLPIGLYSGSEKSDNISKNSVIEKEIKKYIENKSTNGITINKVNILNNLTKDQKVKIELIFDVEENNFSNFTKLLSDLKIYSDSNNVELIVKFFIYNKVNINSTNSGSISIISQ